MFYIVEYEYVGPNEVPDSHVYIITMTPPRTNSSHEIRTDGWLGTTNDTSMNAHGEFDTLDDAVVALDEITGDDYRDMDLSENYNAYVYGYTDADGAIIQPPAVARIAGRLIPMTAADSREWSYPVMDDITADTTDDEITAMVAEIATERAEEGYELDDESVDTMLTAQRDELIQARDSEKEEQDD